MVVDGLFILSTREAFLGVLRSPAAVTSFVSARDAFRGVLLAPVAVAYFGVFCLVMAAKLALANHQRRAKAGLHGASNVLAIGLLGYFVLALFFGVIALLF